MHSPWCSLHITLKLESFTSDELLWVILVPHEIDNLIHGQFIYVLLRLCLRSKSGQQLAHSGSLAPTQYLEFLLWRIEV